MSAHPANGRTYLSRVWTPARLRLAADMWGRDKSAADILGAVNHLPGEPIASAGSIQTKASIMGWKRPGPAKAAQRQQPIARPAPPIPEPIQAPAPAVAEEPTPVAEPEVPVAPPSRSSVVLNCITGDRAEAEALIRQGMSGRAVAADLGLPLAIVAGWVGELRDRGEIP